MRPHDWAGFEQRPQPAGDLGQKMQDSLCPRFRAGRGGAAVIIGTDCPGLTTGHLTGSVYCRCCKPTIWCWGRRLDGGYYLLGMNRHLHPALFANKPWSTATVRAETLADAARLGLRVHLLPALQDVDTVDDLRHLAAAGRPSRPPRFARMVAVTYLLFLFRMVRIVSAMAVTGLVAGLVACSPDAGPEAVAASAPQPSENPLTRRGGVFRQQWAMDRLWEDGLAEVATYDAERVVYGEPRRFQYTLITVKEEFNQQYNTKTDDYQRKDLFPVMKVNQFCSIPTDTYPYHFLTSAFFRRDQPVQLHKLTTSSQEWCGNTFKAFTDDGLQYQQTYNSYWDGEGSGHRTPAPRRAV